MRRARVGVSGSDAAPPVRLLAVQPPLQESSRLKMRRSTVWIEGSTDTAAILSSAMDCGSSGVTDDQSSSLP
jgi:hypothetical protein